MISPERFHKLFMKCWPGGEVTHEDICLFMQTSHDPVLCISLQNDKFSAWVVIHPKTVLGAQ